MDHVPAIVIDPKGDIANLMLTFPGLAAEDFRPWINEEDATAIIQGFGNVGSHAALTLSHYGVKITGISDVTGALWNDGGILYSPAMRYNLSA